MIVDDDEDDRLLFCEALLIADPTSRVLTATNGENALKVLMNPEDTLPDFIFLDLNMPKMNGWQCLQQLRKIEILKYTPVIIFTTSKENQDFVKMKLLGNVHFFTKPPKFTSLVNGIQCVLNEEWISIKELNKVAHG